eukprot:jgi/Mesvir1/6944/Mv09096-RA.1
MRADELSPEELEEIRAMADRMTRGGNLTGQESRPTMERERMPYSSAGAGPSVPLQRESQPYGGASASGTREDPLAGEYVPLQRQSQPYGSAGASSSSGQGSSGGNKNKRKADDAEDSSQNKRQQRAQDDPTVGPPPAPPPAPPPPSRPRGPTPKPELMWRSVYYTARDGTIKPGETIDENDPDVQELKRKFIRLWEIKDDKDKGAERKKLFWKTHEDWTPAKIHPFSRAIWKMYDRHSFDQSRVGRTRHARPTRQKRATTHRVRAGEMPPMHPLSQNPDDPRFFTTSDNTAGPSRVSMQAYLEEAKRAERERMAREKADLEEALMYYRPLPQNRPVPRPPAPRIDHPPPDPRFETLTAEQARQLSANLQASGYAEAYQRAILEQQEAERMRKAKEKAAAEELKAYYASRRGK